MRTKKLTHAARVLRIRELLDVRPFLTVEELQKEFGVSRRTVYNDFEALQAANIQVYSVIGSNGEAQWKIATTAKKQTVTLAAGQILPFGMAKLALSFLEGTDIHSQLSLIMDKLAQGLTPLAKSKLERLGKKISIVPYGPKSYKKKADTLDDILSGLLYDHYVEIWYRSPQKERASKQVVAPLTLMMYREALYLIGDSKTREARLVFAVDRISKSQWLKGHKFDYPEDYSPEQFKDGSFGLQGGEPSDVEILFDKEQAKYVCERLWHRSQTFEELKDGRMSMKLHVSGTFDVMLWLLGQPRSRIYRVNSSMTFSNKMSFSKTTQYAFAFCFHK